MALKNKKLLLGSILCLVLLAASSLLIVDYLKPADIFERGAKSCHNFINQSLLEVPGTSKKVAVYSPLCLVSKLGKTQFFDSSSSLTVLRPRDMIIRSINLTHEFDAKTISFLTIDEDVVSNPILAHVISLQFNKITGGMVPLEKPTGYVTICGKANNDDSAFNIFLSSTVINSTLIKNNSLYFCSHLLNTKQMPVLDVGFLLKNTTPDIKLKLYFPPTEKWGEKITAQDFYDNFNYFAPFNVTQI